MCVCGHYLNARVGSLKVSMRVYGQILPTLLLEQRPILATANWWLGLTKGLPLNDGRGVKTDQDITLPTTNDQRNKVDNYTTLLPSGGGATRVDQYSKQHQGDVQGSSFDNCSTLSPRVGQ